MLRTREVRINFSKSSKIFINKEIGLDQDLDLSGSGHLLMADLCQLSPRKRATDVKCRGTRDQVTYALRGQRSLRDVYTGPGRNEPLGTLPLVGTNIVCDQREHHAKPSHVTK